MDGDRRSAQVERLEVVDTGRRRRWSEDEKLKIVLESLRAPRQVAATARRYGVSRSLLLRWRRSFRPEPKDAVDQPGFLPAMVIAECGPTHCPVAPASSGRAIEIEFASGARMRITGAVDAATLEAAVAALADGRLR
ncbi:transposase [Bradyrhizobium sp. 182]|uniref:IS66-like element accessory protein TnpA n=1 Tax=unclassified Bradyrhizobium TaxID=2631580 RepID=UPI001FFBFA01|nr:MULTISPECIES: transposase [unclassified Bradyrhizobium]MCK1422602.1 transposase [Bradyrhizobium sp. CW12]MCK1528198.1 transposase [Bradyrhizobium sp. 182]MCK1643290.1 transposase [Bradyrhizobium sp. 154]